MQDTSAVKQNWYGRFIASIERPVSIAPLITFRIAFGFIMFISTVRYMWMGWVETQLIKPLFHFHYYGFDWVKPLPGDWLYLVFAILILSTVAITIGAYYRFFATLFFILFSYVELIDLTYYLNHYYFVGVVSFMLVFVPANRSLSFDVRFRKIAPTEKVSAWCIVIFKIQIAIVYIYAGLAKINYDWLFRALPLAIWLPAKSGIPLIGWAFKYKITAYLFSWFGMLFDTFIILGLLIKKTRLPAYFLVIVFHAMTGILFQIGIFPLVMIFGVTIFFSPALHEKLVATIENKIFKKTPACAVAPGKTNKNHLLYPFLILFMSFQLLFPWRYLLYPGNLFWTEEGYRFSWRVMLMEKAGTATFYVKDGENGREGSVINSQFLNPHQEKQMAMQPDMILQFAHFLGEHFSANGMNDPIVRAECKVTLNGRRSRDIVDPTADLTTITDTWKPKEWITPFEENK
ncbi:MAG: HTTM domain-containing protein [Bacteroidota bacterium]